MFYVKKPEYINKTLRFPMELIKTLERIAQQKRVSLNNLIVQCCVYALENIGHDDCNHSSDVRGDLDKS